MKRHLKAKHTISEPTKTKRGRSEDGDEDDATPPLKMSASGQSAGTALRYFLGVQSSEKIIQLLVEMVVENMLPIATVQHSGFQNLVHYVLASKFSMLCRASLMARTEAKYNELKARLST
eukprot:scpid88755/ scgid28336/ 